MPCIHSPQTSSSIQKKLFVITSLSFNTAPPAIALQIRFECVNRVRKYFSATTVFSKLLFLNVLARERMRWNRMTFSLAQRMNRCDFVSKRLRNYYSLESICDGRYLCACLRSTMNLTLKPQLRIPLRSKVWFSKRVPLRLVRGTRSYFEPNGSLPRARTVYSRDSRGWECSSSGRHQFEVLVRNEVSTRCKEAQGGPRIDSLIPPLLHHLGFRPFMLFIRMIEITVLHSFMSYFIVI